MNALLKHDDLFSYGPESRAETVASVIKQVLLGADDRVVQSKTWYQRGAISTSDANAHSLVCYILDGFFEVEIDGKSQILGPSGSFIVPAGTPYGLSCLEDGVLLGVFASQITQPALSEVAR